MSERILFLCTGNSCRSQMAEGFANKYSSYKAFSAGTKKTNLDPLAVKVMSEIDIDISQHFSKTFNDLVEFFLVEPPSLLCKKTSSSKSIKSFPYKINISIIFLSSSYNLLT